MWSDVEFYFVWMRAGRSQCEITSKTNEQQPKGAVTSKNCWTGHDSNRNKIGIHLSGYTSFNMPIRTVSSRIKRREGENEIMFRWNSFGECVANSSGTLAG